MPLNFRVQSDNKLTITATNSTGGVLNNLTITAYIEDRNGTALWGSSGSPNSLTNSSTATGGYTVTVPSTVAITQGMRAFAKVTASSTSGDDAFQRLLIDGVVDDA